MPDSPRRRQRPIRPGPLARHRHGRPTTDAHLRKPFNDGILDKAASGEFTTKVVNDAHPSPPKADEPICTRSQLIAYYDAAGKKVAEAHQYLRTDGTIGASGIPDPKEVIHKGVLYY